METDLFFLDENNNLIYNESLVEEGSLFDPEEDLHEELEIIDDVEPDSTVNITDTSSDPITYGDTITYNIYAIPSDSTGYPNANSLSYLEDVVRSYPLDYDYVCYRTDKDYAQSMILYIGDDATVSGNRITFDQCDVIELDYQYQNYNSSWLDRNYYQDSNVSISLGSDTLAYTNVVPGYASFDVTTSHKTSSFGLVGILVGVVALTVLLRLIGGSRNV